MNKSLLNDAERQELAARIQRNYDYSPTAGLLINRERNRLVNGKIIRQTLYKRMSLRINGKIKFLKYHHLVWVWHKGYWPTQLDHINGDKSDNHIENLREVTMSENILNCEHQWRPNAKTGLPGVSYVHRAYQSSINGEKIYYTDPYKVFFFTIILGKKFV